VAPSGVAAASLCAAAAAGSEVNKVQANACDRHAVRTFFFMFHFPVELNYTFYGRVMAEI
jgi:hypothetical protein